MPAARLFWLLGLGAVLLAAGLAVPKLTVAGLALDAAALAAFVIDLVRARRTPLAAEREWPAMLVQAAPAAIEAKVTGSPRRGVRVRLLDGLCPELAAAPAETTRSIAAGTVETWRHEVVPRRRGEHEVGALRARVLGPWGLAWSQRDLLPPEPRRVYPQVRWDGRVGTLLGLARRRQLGATPYPRQGVGNEVYGLRQYLPGDPLTKVHWKATARHRRLISREETWERGVALVILLDASRAMAGEAGERTKLDHALATALALARVALGRGDQVTVLAFSDRIERTVRIVGAGGGIRRAYAALYDLECRRVEPAYDLAVEAAYELEARGAAMVVLTSVADLAAAELLRDSVLALRRRHRALLVNLQDPALRRLAEAEPQRAAEAFAQISSLDILLANRQLERRLRRAGVRTVSCPADRLALETLTAYLRLFGQHVLAAERRSRVARAIAAGSSAPA